MSYVGQGPGLKTTNIKRFDITGSTSATHVLSWTAVSEQALIITINGVKQQDDAYTIAGSPTTITLSSALLSTDKLEVIGIVDMGVSTFPVDGSVSTATLGNSSVTTVKVGDNAVSLAKMAGITRGSIIVGDASGDPSALATGTTGQFLTTNGSDLSWGAAGSPSIVDNGNATAITIDSLENVMIGPSGGGTPTVAGSTLNIFGNVNSVDGFRPIIRNLNTGTDAHASLWLSATGGGAGGGDPRLVFNIDNVANVFSMGVDNSDTDKFKISAGAALGTTDRMVIDNSGAMTKPSQPCFFAYNATNVPNATGDNTLYGPIIYTTEIYDQGADYNTANGTFTAPVDGRYFIQATLSTGTQTTSHTDGTFDLITSNKTVATIFTIPVLWKVQLLQDSVR